LECGKTFFYLIFDMFEWQFVELKFEEHVESKYSESGSFLTK